MNTNRSNTTAMPPSLPDAGGRRGPGRGGTSVFWTLPLSQVRRFRRDVSIVFDLPRYFDASGASMQRVPDLQQNSFTIGRPLAIPESQFFNTLAPLLVCLHVFRRTVLESVQLNRKARSGTIEVQNVRPGRMLTAKFESCKTSSPQRLPKLLFLPRLFPSQTTRLPRGTHVAQVRNLIFQVQHFITHVQRLANRISNPSPQSSPPSFVAGRGSQSRRNAFVNSEVIARHWSAMRGAEFQFNRFQT